MARPSKREEIARAALQGFHTRGFHATGIADITMAAGVPKGSFYNHFSSKEESATEAIGRYGDSRRFDILTTPGRPPLQRLRAHFEHLGAETVESGYARGCLIGNFSAEVGDHNDELRAALRSGFDTWGRHIRQVLTEAQEAGDLAPGLDVAATSLFLLSAWEGTLLTARADKSHAPFEAFFRTTFEVVLR
jgi:TetR/AcrR family transcriptional repressor of nem operon